MSQRFCVPCPPNLVRPRRAAFSAWRAGSLRGLLLRQSRRSPSGWVMVASFGSFARASRFASLWAGRLGVSCVLRREPGAPWSVSLPCFLGSSHVPPGSRVSARCSWRRFHALVLGSGWF
jgi:hypothetical protein